MAAQWEERETSGDECVNREQWGERLHRDFRSCVRSGLCRISMTSWPSELGSEKELKKKHPAAAFSPTSIKTKEHLTRLGQRGSALIQGDIRDEKIQRLAGGRGQPARLREGNDKALAAKVNH